MARSSSGMIARCLIGLLVLSWSHVAFGDDAIASKSWTESEIKVRRDLAEARTLLHFNLTEHGDLQALDEADRALNRAKADLGTGADRREAELSTELEHLRRDVTQMREAASTTFFGRFPLARILVEDDSGSGTPPSISTIPDMARSLALSAAFKQSLEWLPGANQQAVVLLSREDMDDQTAQIVDKLIDKVAPAAIAATPNIMLIPGIARSELVAPAWDAPDAAFTDVCRQILKKVGHDERAMNLCILLVRAVNPEPDDRAWYQVQGRVFYGSAVDASLQTQSPTALESAKEYVGSGLGIDRSRDADVIMASIGALLVLAVVLYVALLYFSQRPTVQWHEWIAPPMAGFAIGFVLPGLIAPVLEHWAPGPLMPALQSAWWPAISGALLLLAPAVAFNLGARSLTNMISSLRCDGRWGLALMATGLGVAAFFGRTALLAVGGGATLLLPALALSAGAILYIFGRALDSGDRYPPSMALVATLLALAFGIAAMAASPVWVLGVGVCALVIELAVSSRAASHVVKKGSSSSATSSESKTSAPPASLADLLERARSPDFQPSPSYAEAHALLERQGAGRTVWLGLHGPSGSGKSAAATQLIADLRARYPDARILSASCRRDAPPYQPLHEALGEILDTSTLAGSAHSSAGLDSVLQELVGLFVPYWSLLSGLGGGSGGSNVAAGEFYAAVSASLRKLSRKQPVILYLDNLQWLDEGSAALLRHLYERLPPGGDAHVVVLLCGRDESSFHVPGLADCLLHIPPPSRAQQLAILTGSLGFEQTSAQRIVDALGVLREEPGGLFWLFQAVSAMASADMFEATDHGFVFRSEATAALPVPAELRDALVEKLKASSDHQIVLQSAALLGEVFSVSTLASALALDHLELLQTLRHLEQTAHIVVDLPEDDDHYSFSSTFMFETVREELTAPSAEDARRPSKLVQELHSRIATAIERSSDEKPVYALARHWSLAGSRHAAKSLSYSRLAAQQARESFAFDEARRWLALADQAARTVGEPFDAASQQMHIDCDEAHVRGRDRAKVAERAWHVVEGKKSVDHDVLVVAARTCYDAYRDTNHTVWHDRALKLAQRIVDSGTTPIEKAAGYHMLGVNLPFDRATDRLSALRQGLALAESASDRRDRSLIESKILGSLGEQLSYGAMADRGAARDYFERSLEIRTSQNLGDLPGQARAHGGLGRLALGDDPPDFARARHHFVEDLKISETIDDIAGISMSHCSLARCDRADGNFKSAATHLVHARETARALKDRCFAIIGELALAVDTKRSQDAEKAGRELLAIIASDGLPLSCADELLRVLGEAESLSETEWGKALVAASSPKQSVA